MIVLIKEDKIKGKSLYKMVKLSEYKEDKVIEYVKSSELQRKGIKELAEKRQIDEEFLINEGIFVVKGIDDLWDMIDSLGINEHDIGITERNTVLFEQGYIVPVFDAYKRLLMFVKYNNNPSMTSKYININLYERAEVSEEEDEDYLGERDTVLYQGVKLLGMDTTEQGIKEGRMFVVEGVFDNKRVKSLGLPVTSILGNKLMAYHKIYYNRFPKVYYIQDMDIEGDSGYRRFKRGVPQAERIMLPSLRQYDKEAQKYKYIKDIDEFGAKGQKGGIFQYEWEDFVNNLKNK